MKDRITDLVSRIEAARTAYYNSQPIMDDDVYDALLDELRVLDPENPQVSLIGADPTGTWPKVRHNIPMGSLDKVQTSEAFMVWSEARGYRPILVSDKLDGLSLELTYEGGRLVRAATRGNGEEGQDITPNALRIPSIPKTIPYSANVCVRGEVLLEKADLVYFPGQSGTRTSAIGTLQRSDGTNCEHLKFYAYKVPDVDFNFEIEAFEWLKEQGFLTPRYALLAATHVAEYRQSYVDGIRENLPYDIDGLVLTINKVEDQLSYGTQGGNPQGAVAFKFDPVSVETTLLNITYQVGSSGRLTPVGIFAPVTILGAEVNRASLYNYAYIKQLGLSVGDKILVTRANDVIPRITKVSEKGSGEAHEPLQFCPECFTELLWSGEYLVCPNVGSCPAQTIGRLKLWVKGLSILDWGVSLLTRVVDERGVRSVADLYKLTEDTLASLTRMGVTSAKTAYKRLREPLPAEFSRVAGSLGIPLCSHNTMAGLAAIGYDTPEKLLALTADKLEDVDGFGSKKTSYLLEWLARNPSIFQDLSEAGVTFRAPSTGPLSKKTVCFTGKSNLKRAVLEKMARDAGATVKDDVSTGLTYLVLADPNSTTAKANAARKHGTQCISEEEFLRKVSES